MVINTHNWTRQYAKSERPLQGTQHLLLRDSFMELFFLQAHEQSNGRIGKANCKVISQEDQKQEEIQWAKESSGLNVR